VHEQRASTEIQWAIAGRHILFIAVKITLEGAQVVVEQKVKHDSQIGDLQGEVSKGMMAGVSGRVCDVN
jgi:hypothetical protein